MDGLFIEYKLYKAIGLVVLVFVVCFVYKLITGRSIEEARRERDQGQGK